jgi:CheY-like chemotaxis protein
MLTTSSNPKDIEKMKEKGITDFFDKPLTEEKLMSLIEKYFS